jgi:Lar family restriction alleviation protein
MALYLRPCPFCGGAGVPATSWVYAGDQAREQGSMRYVIRCQACEAAGPWAWDSRSAHERWNRRAELSEEAR